MCRLFALHAGPDDVAAEFWLLDAPDSFARQSETNADGFGMASLTSREGLLLLKSPVQAVSSTTFEGVSRKAKASQYLAHLRYADTGGVALRNTHPFFADGRVFAHNGVVGDLDRLEERLGDARWMVNGETDSERSSPSSPSRSGRPGATSTPASSRRSRSWPPATSSTA